MQEFLFFFFSKAVPPPQSIFAREAREPFGPIHVFCLYFHFLFTAQAPFLIAES